MPTDDNRDRILSEMRSMHNDIGITGLFEVARLVGFYEDDADYYYRLSFCHGREVLASAVGRFISLRGKISDEEYRYLDEILERNCAPATNEFSVTKGPVAQLAERRILDPKVARSTRAGPASTWTRA